MIRYRYLMLCAVLLILTGASSAGEVAVPAGMTPEQYLDSISMNQGACDKQRSCDGWAVVAPPRPGASSELWRTCRERVYEDSTCKCWRVKCTDFREVVWKYGTGNCPEPPTGPDHGCTRLYEEDCSRPSERVCIKEDDDDGDCQLQQTDSNISGIGGGTELTTVNTECGNNSPILIDVAGNGFAMTDAANGVHFDLDSDGRPEHLSWTAAAADDAFLAVDRNGNGIIDNGRELFGNFAPQFASPDPNGFLALLVYDQPADGGNGDGVIDARDRLFALLRLWQDSNHDGISQASELQPLEASGIGALELTYKTSKQRDEHGNLFKYRAKIDRRGTTAAHWAWDVYLVTH